MSRQLYHRGEPPGQDKQEDGRLRAGLDAVENSNISYLCRESNSYSSVLKLVTYTDFYSPVPIFTNYVFISNFNFNLAYNYNFNLLHH
jgi:hypothetical protein